MKKILFFALVLIFALTFWASPTFAQKEQPKLKIFIHYPKPDAGKPSEPICSITGSDQVADYSLAGWHLPINYVYHVNYKNKPANLSQNQIQTAISQAIGTWQVSQPKVSTSEGSSTTINKAAQDGINAVAWGKISGKAIAVSYVWYYNSTGQVAESDIIFNKNLSWAYTPYNTDCGGVPNAYDLQDIATHEFGHWVGLDDLYSSIDSELTMYGYANKGELKKDTLGNGDILGALANY